MSIHKVSNRNSKLTDTLLYDVMAGKDNLLKILTLLTITIIHIGMDKLVNLNVLNFPNNILTDECIDVLTKSIANKKIQELNLSNNKVGRVVAKMKTNEKVGNEGGKNLAVFIASGKSCLKVFQFENNSLNQQNMAGQEINLSLNLLEDEGSVPLLKAISLDKSVQGFSLSSNRWKHCELRIVGVEPALL